MKYVIVCLLVSLSNLGFSQDYESYFVGSTTNIITQPTFGICLMGGATEDDNAMQWFLNRADGGDVVVIRTSGSDGYNDYFYSDLGVSLNSVETLVINNAAGAVHPYVLNQVANAEAIWFAGGNQATYVNYFKDNALMDLLNAHVNTKQAPIGGTSAGMAIMGEFYFDAIAGSVTSQQALSNPFGASVSVGQGSFLEVPFLANTITDTHYDNPDRKGRHLAFLARIQDETGERAFGIAAEEYVGICIDEAGNAQVFGEFPSFEDYAYFLQVNCLETTLPEQLQEGLPLDWNLNNEAVKAYVLPATSSGNNSFDVNTWETGNGGTWENWWVENGSLFTASASALDCEPLGIQTADKVYFKMYPNPTSGQLFFDFSAAAQVEKISVYNLHGKLLLSQDEATNALDLNFLAAGMYLVEVQTGRVKFAEKLVVE